MVDKSDEAVVVIDPPRSGCSAAFIEQLLDFAPRGIVYVSCDVATQARDTALIRMGKDHDHGARVVYDIVDCTPFDMFPHTRHIENVFTFRRRIIIMS